jgi:hypothetical protein
VALVLAMEEAEEVMEKAEVVEVVMEGAVE